MVEIDIMKVIVGDTKIMIDDKFIEYSPFLQTMSTTPVNVDHVDGWMRVDADLDSFHRYVSFLEGKFFQMEEKDVSLFEFMGHVNTLGFGPELWGVKLHDNWIRDNFHKHRLYEDSLYGLVEIPIRRKVDIPMINAPHKFPPYVRGNIRDYSCAKITVPSIDPEGVVIAGGCALWMAGYADSFSDIDLFFTGMDKKKASQYIYNIRSKPRYHEYGVHQDTPAKAALSIAVGEHTASFHDDVHMENLEYTDDTNIDNGDIDHVSESDGPMPKTWTKEKKIQFVLRTYTSPTEVVHGFDLDCVGFIYVVATGKLYATRRALLSVKCMENWFDPSRSSPSYDWRLIKYKKRGFRIILPHLTKENLNPSEVEKLYRGITNLIVNPDDYVLEVLHELHNGHMQHNIHYENPGGTTRIALENCMKASQIANEGDREQEFKKIISSLLWEISMIDHGLKESVEMLCEFLQPYADRWLNYEERHNIAAFCSVTGIATPDSIWENPITWGGLLRRYWNQTHDSPHYRTNHEHM